LQKKRYDYYRNRILSFDSEPSSNSVQWMPLGEVGPVRMCKRILKNQTNSTQGIPFYKIGTFGGKCDSYISPKLYDEYRNKYSYPKKGDILISAAGTIGKAIIFDGEPSYFQDSNIVWIDNDEKKVINKYLFYCYQIINWKVDDGGVIKRLYNENLRQTIIPIPPLAEQERIVNILDRFEALVTNLSNGLPAEIERVRKQYEYYRNKLLTFPIAEQ
jgi:type I restriction enzyme S subunit